MRKYFFYMAVSFITIFIYSNSYSQSFRLVGGRDLSHIHTAWTIPQGQFSLHGFASSYFHTVVKTEPGQTPTSETFWDVQSAAGIHFASSKNIEWSLTPVIYQDTHRGKGFNVPDDLFLGVKLGSFGSKYLPFKFGFKASTRVPIAKEHNLLFESYNGGGVEIGLMSMISYSPDLLFPENTVNFHLNMGILHHNDVGKVLSGAAIDSNNQVLDPVREFLWGFGLMIPNNQFDFSFELFGQAFIAKPPLAAFNRSNQIYFSPSIKYRANHLLAFNAALDLRVSSHDALNESNLDIIQSSTSIPSNPNWRMNVGVTLRLNHTPPRGSKQLFVTTNGRMVPRQKVLEKQLDIEEEKTQTAEKELDVIRNERKRMETMLERLRSMLYKDQVGKINPEDIESKETDEPTESVDDSTEEPMDDVQDETGNQVKEKEEETDQELSGE